MLVAMVWSCGTPENTKPETPKTLVELAENPQILDSLLTNADGSINIAFSDSAARLYFAAYNLNQKDSVAPYYLMKSADILRFVPGKALMAIKKYLQLSKQYPEHELAPLAFFMTGLTFDQNLNDQTRAALVYADFIEKYPEHPMAMEAKNLLALAEDTETTDLDKVHEWMNEVDNKK